MANAYKILGSVSPSSTSETTLYTVPTATEAVISSLVVCNQSTAAQTFRCAVNDGSTTSSADYIYYGLSVPANDTFVASIAITLNASDKVYVQTGSTGTGGTGDGTTLSYSLFGAEIT